MSTQPPAQPGNDETPNDAITEASVQREVLMDEAARDTIDTHVGADTSIEQGGVLVGTVDEATGRVDVIAAVPATRAVGAVASLTFTHEAWDEVNDIIAKDHPESRMVGWYHSHPGFGIFLSQYDTFIHENFFSARWQLAYVVDPLLGKAGFFGWEDDSIVRLTTWAVLARGSARAVKEPDRSGTTTDTPNKRSGLSFSAALAIALVALLGGVLGGYFAHTNSAAPAVALDVPASTPLSNGLTLITAAAAAGDSQQYVALIRNGSNQPVSGVVRNCAPGRIDPAPRAATSPSVSTAPNAASAAPFATASPTPSVTSTARPAVLPAGSCDFRAHPIPAHESREFVFPTVAGSTGEVNVAPVPAVQPSFIPATTAAR